MRFCRVVLFYVLPWLLLSSFVFAEVKEEIEGKERKERKIQKSVLSIAAAADMRFALGEIVDKFKKTHSEILVQISYGASGSLAAQINQEAPFDLFLAADKSYIQELIKKGRAEKKDEFYYGVGKLVLWVSKSFKPDLQKKGIRTLLESDVQKIALANPRYAPYGKAAIEALKTSGIFDSVQNKIVYGESVAQAAQFVISHAAQVGVIALSLALATEMKEKGEYWIIPPSLYPPLNQVGILIKDAKNSNLASSFKSFMMSKEGQLVLKKYGFAH